MVKNFGGKHGKKIARKNAHSNSEMSANKKMRFANGHEEVYGLVTKCLGNSQFLIICNDRVERLCILRNKFTGRNKQSNMISIGSWAIVGLRNWETSKPNKKDKCDMLEVYTNNEKYKLIQESKVSSAALWEGKSSPPPRASETPRASRTSRRPRERRPEPPRAGRDRACREPGAAAAGERRAPTTREPTRNRRGFPRPPPRREP